MELSQDQLNAIRHRGSHLQITACAGSGKAEVMARRVSGLIEEGVSPAAIIFFTFTDRAAVSLKIRINQRIAAARGPAYLDRPDPLFIGTMPSYCLRMLQEHVPAYGNSEILDENRLAGLVSREQGHLELDRLGGKHRAPIFDFLKNIQVVENERLDPQDFAGTDFAYCYQKYVAMLRGHRFFSCGQIITEAIRALQDPLLYQRVHGPLRHLLVDEYQDINPAQEALIQLLAAAPVLLTAVGDDDQSICEGRGSDVNNILTFKQRYKPAASQSLFINRQSRPRIIHHANQFVRTISPRLPKAMVSQRSPGAAEVHWWAGATDLEEGQTVAETIERLVKKGHRHRDIALLFRSVRTSAEPHISALRSRGIPFRCAGRTGLFCQPEAALVGKTYAWLVDTHWKHHLYAQPRPVALDDLCAQYAEAFNGGHAIPDLEEYLRDWKELVGDSSTPTQLIRDYYRLLRLLNVHNLDLDNPLEAARMGCLARFSAVLADYEQATRRACHVEEDGQSAFRAGPDRGIGIYRNLFHYLQYYSLDAYEDVDGEDTSDVDAVSILTVQQAKGFQWPVVFLPSLTDKRFPSGKAGRPQDWLLPPSVFPLTARRRYEGGDAEERRLFYVAMTRACDSLYLSWFAKRTSRFHPSPFLTTVAGGTPTIQTSLPLPDPFTPDDEQSAKLLTLTLSELATYECCPFRYRLSSLLGFQPLLATELAHGNAIDHARRTVPLSAAVTPAATANTLIAGIVQKQFPAQPQEETCPSCTVRIVCKHAACGKHDF